VIPVRQPIASGKW